MKCQVILVVICIWNNVYHYVRADFSDIFVLQVARTDDNFIKLCQLLHTKFPDSRVPVVSKVSTLFADINPKARKQELEEFLKNVVSSKQLVEYHLTLEFLGIRFQSSYLFIFFLAVSQ